jgi:DNA-binding beta-propeller fold protein YncE
LARRKSGLEVTERGIVYATAPDSTIDTGTTVPAPAASAGEYKALLTGLSANTTYYVRAYATNALGTSYGACRHFKTPVSVTTITTGDSMLAPVAVNETTNRIYAGSLWSGKLYALDGNTDTVSASMNAASRDFTVAVNEKTNKIYSASGKSVYITDGATNEVTTITLDTKAYAMAVNEITNKIYITSENMTAPVYVLDGVSNSLEATVVTGTKGCAVAVNETANEIYVADDGGGKVVVINGLITRSRQL